MNRIQLEDFRALAALRTLPWEDLRGKTLLITGGTGLIGGNLVRALLFLNREKALNLHLILPVRDLKAAGEMFPEGGSALTLLPYSLGDEPAVSGAVDYIVHLASPTDSRFFKDRPVDTITANLDGTRAMLELARKKKVQKMVFLSTMEVYGTPPKGHPVTESELGAFDTMSARNSYPIAKQACEALGYAYFSQYGVPAVILRLTQTFGPGVRYDDGRVFAEFMRCVLERRDIVLRSPGLTERPYLYTADAVSAILHVLLKGEPGEAYTAANPDTYCSIRDMAVLVADSVADGEIQVRYDLREDPAKFGYADTLTMMLDTAKIRELGWEPTVSLREMFTRMIAFRREQEGDA